MKLDKYYSIREFCPTTNEPVFDVHTDGCCSICGHTRKGTISHYYTMSGKWERPTLFEYIFKGKRSVWHELSGSKVTKFT